MSKSFDRIAAAARGAVKGAKGEEPAVSIVSMREKIADLLARQNGYTSLLAMPASQRDNWRNRADAVLDALMDFTHEMHEAGLDKFVEMHGRAPSTQLLNSYCAMIRAAKEGK